MTTKEMMIKKTTELLKTNSIPLLDASVSFKGFDDLGKSIALDLFESGATIVAISDKKTGIFAHKGIDVEDLIKHLDQGKSLSSYEATGVLHIPSKSVLYVDCDLLIPTDTKHLINVDNYKHLKCSFILESTPETMTDTAYHLLKKKVLTAC